MDHGLRTQDFLTGEDRVLGEGGKTLRRVALANQMEAAHEEMKALAEG